MNFKRMKELTPELGSLEQHAEHAGRHGASWWDFLLASHESLSKLVGRGAVDERLQDAASYEIARAALYASWAKGAKVQPVPPPEPSQHADSVQTTMFDVTELYT